MDFTIEGASYFPSSGKLAMGGADMWVRLFDYNNMEEIACHKGHHGPVHCVRFAPGGESFASGSEDGTIRIWITDVGENDVVVGNDESSNGVATKVAGTTLNS